MWKKLFEPVDMTQGDPVRQIVKFMIPMLIGNVFQQLYNTVDSIVVGKYIGDNALAAVGSASPILNLLLVLFMGISVGAGIMVSQYFGAKQRGSLSHAIGTSITMMIAASLIMMAIAPLVSMPLLRLLNTPAEIIDWCDGYLRTIFLGVAGCALYNIFGGILRGLGDSMSALIYLVIATILNIFLDIYFVANLSLGVPGVALATVLSNVVSSAMLFVYLVRDKGLLRVVPSDLKINSGLCREIVRIGLPAGLQGVLFSVSNILVQSAINSLGADVMAGSAAAFNIEICAFFMMNAYTQTLTTFIGQNYGAGKPERCLRITRICNPEPEVIEAGLIRMRMILYFEPLDVLMEEIPGAMRGYGRSLPPAVVSLIGVVGTRILWVNLVFPMFRTFRALVTVYPITWVITDIALLIVYFRMKNVDLKEFFAGADSAA